MVIMKQPSKDPFEMAYEEEQDSPIESPTANDDVVTGTQSTADKDNNQNSHLNNNNDDKKNSNANNPSTSGATPLSPTTTAGKNKDDEEEEEEENMDMELGKFPSSGDPDKMAKMQAILSQFTEEQMSRYESFRSSGFQKANMKKSQGRVQQTSWTMREDQVLCDAWVSIYENPIICSNQIGKGMWQRIREIFKRDLPCNPNNRTADSLQGRWKLINKFVSKFNGILFTIENEQPSGNTRDTRIQMARQTYQWETKKAFAYDHCWAILSECPKWNRDWETKMAKSRPVREDTIPNQASESSLGDGASNEPERPEGSKKAKERKRKNAESVQLMQNYFQKLEERFDLEDTATNDTLELRRQELEATREKTEAIKEKNRIKLYEIEAKILTTDLDSLTGVAREVMRRRQEEVTTKWAREYGLGGSSSGM